MGKAPSSVLEFQFNPPREDSIVNISSSKIGGWKWFDLYAEIRAAEQSNKISGEKLRLQLDGKPVFDCIGMEAYRFNDDTVRDVLDPTLLLVLRNRYISVIMHCIEYPTGSGQYVFRDLNMSKRLFNIDKLEDIEAFKKIYLRSDSTIGLFPDYQEDAMNVLQAMRDLQQRLNSRKMRLPLTPGWIIFPEMHNNNQILLSELGVTSQQELEKLIEFQNKCQNEVFYFDRKNGPRQLLRKIERARNQYPTIIPDMGVPD
ncbi:hypothetical protein [Akkermansia glycaniphila]|nr:hypothetical protein [Akkermansia glycaniphila]